MKKKTSMKKSILKSKFSSPISEGEEYDLEIAGTKRGNGFALVRNFLVLVPNAKRGDYVHVQIKEVKQDHAIARIMSSEEPMSLSENLKEQYEEAEAAAAAGLINPAAGEEEE